MNSLATEPIWLIEVRSVLLHAYFLLVMAIGFFISLRGYKKERSIGYLMLALYFLSPFIVWGMIKIFGPTLPPASDGHVVVRIYSRLAIPETLLVIGLALIGRKQNEVNKEL